MAPFRTPAKVSRRSQNCHATCRYASAVREFIADRVVAVEVSDRTGDGLKDIIRYEWSGILGDPLRRSMNGGGVFTALPDVQSFSLGRTIESRVIQDLVPTTVASGPIRYVNQPFGLIESNFDLSTDLGIATDFLPKFPEGTVSWSISSVEVKCESSSTTSGVVRARLATADAQRRPAATLFEKTINESSLPVSLNWYTVPFSGSPALLTDQRVCIVFLHASGSGTSMRLRVDEDPFELSGATTWKKATTNGGATWSQVADDNLIIRVYGSYRLSGTSVGLVNRDFTTAFSAELQSGSDPSTRARSTIPLRNRPQVIP